MYFHLRSWGSTCSSGRWEDAQEAAILFQGGDATPQQTLDWTGMQSERKRGQRKTWERQDFQGPAHICMSFTYSGDLKALLISSWGFKFFHFKTVYIQ